MEDVYLPLFSLSLFLSVWQEEALPLVAGSDMNVGFLKYGTLYSSPESLVTLNSCHFVRFLSASGQYHGELKKVNNVKFLRNSLYSKLVNV